MRYLLLFSIWMLTACGPPVAEGLWFVTEKASHDCLSDDEGQLICDATEDLDKTISSGLIRVDALSSGRLRVIDLQGHSILGKAYADGAQFRWYHEQQEADCSQTLDIELSLKIVDDKLTGFRRDSNTRGKNCNQPGLHDLGFLLDGQRYQESAE